MMRNLSTLLVCLTALFVLASCQGSKEDQAIASQMERTANAARFRVVNLTGGALSLVADKVKFSDLDQGQGTPMTKIRAGKEFAVECGAAGAKKLTFSEKLPEKVKRTYYVTIENGTLKSTTIDDDPMEPSNGPLIRAVNLSGETAAFKATVDGKDTDLGSPATGSGASTSPSIPAGKLVGTTTAGTANLKTPEFDATNDNSFSLVAYKDKAGKVQVALIVNHQLPLKSGAGASPTG